jgi:membrane protease YdiL (CAAX protease family)
MEDNLQIAPAPVPSPVPRKTWLDRAQALFEVLLLCGLVSSILATLPFTFNESARAGLLKDIRWMSLYVLLESTITLALLWLVLRAHQDHLNALCFRWQRWRPDVIIGLALVPLLFGCNIAMAMVFQTYFPEYFQESNPLTDLIRTPRDLALFIGITWFAGGIKEEFQRAFILQRFRSHLGGARLGLILWSIVFGAGHYVQGTQGIVAAGLFGLIFGITYLARGSLIAPIVAHGFYDTAALLAHWFFSARG